MADEVFDETITIDVKGGQYDGQTLVYDVAIVMMASTELQRRHKLEEKQEADGSRYYIATSEFVIALSDKLRELGYKSTPAIAAKAWELASQRFEEIQKKTSESPS